MKRLLLFNDLCGFRQLAVNSSADAVFQFYAPYVTTTVLPTEDLGITSMIMSDTLLATPNDGDRAFLRLCMYASIEGFSAWHRMLFSKEFLPLRGALSFDELMFGLFDVTTQAMMREPITKHLCQVVLGRAVILCHEHDKQQEWFCTSLVPANTEDIKDLLAEEYAQCVAQGYIVEYDIPVKGNSSVRGSVINAYYHWHYEHLRKQLITAMETSDEEIKRKYANTIDFYDYVHENKIIPGYGRCA